MDLSRLVERVEQWSALDRVANPVASAARAVLRPGRLRDLLHGLPLGHPLHPALVQVPVGAWSSAALLDALPGHERSADTLIGLGCATAVPAAIAGWADWSVQHPQQRRVGLIHAAANAAAIGLYAGSLLMRLRRRRSTGRLLAYAGYGAAAAGAFVGGHLAYRQAAAVNHAEDVPHLLAPGWHRLDQLTRLPDGEPVMRMVDDYPVLLYRSGDTVSALSGRCSHLSGPLHQGSVHDGAVTCPWHGSTFSLTDGHVRGGPATSPQPSLSTRVVDGRVEVCLAGE